MSDDDALRESITTYTAERRNMGKRTGRRLREDVYVIGAGFAFDLGYPLTSGILVNVWKRLGMAGRRRLEKFVRFHHTGFNPLKATSYPDIEQLLTEISVNEQMFDASRPAEGNFKRSELIAIRQELLQEVAAWFHELYHAAVNTQWLVTFANHIVESRAAIISFNWDLLLDHRLFTTNLMPESYGLGPRLGNGPVLMKPHGSLNWYDAKEIKYVRAEKRVQIFSRTETSPAIEAFLYPRAINSKIGRKYSPLIVPPTYIKDFQLPIFRVLWQRTTALLSTAENIYFLGYSLPQADMQAQFILRCAFHNQIEGRLTNKGGRTIPTGPANVFVVNPDQNAARRIEATAGPHIKCSWIAKRITDWLAMERR